MTFSAGSTLPSISPCSASNAFIASRTSTRMWLFTERPS
nr:MAG TPA: hypothetical protein [Caudoviricetes sp.]